jgi:hypothetical protein
MSSLVNIFNSNMQKRNTYPGGKTPPDRRAANLEDFGPPNSDILPPPLQPVFPKTKKKKTKKKWSRRWSACRENTETKIRKNYRSATNPPTPAQLLRWETATPWQAEEVLLPVQRLWFLQSFGRW